MKATATLLLAAVAAVVLAQTPPPPGGGRPTTQAASVQSNVPPVARTKTALPETLRILGIASVQKDLQMTQVQYNALSTLAKGATSRTTEDQALAAVAKVLRAGQTARLEELLVQDMGYGVLTLAFVRNGLSLTESQSSSITAILASEATARKALASANAAISTLNELQSDTNAALAKILTAEQDARLKAMAGKALGA